MNRAFRVVVLVALLTVLGAATSMALQVYQGPTEITGTVIQVYSGNSLAVFDGERTSVVVLEGVKTPGRGEDGFMEAASFLHELLYQKTVRVQITRKAKYITYGVVVEAEENINVNAQVLAQPFAEEQIEEALGGAVASLTLRGNEFHSATAGFSITKPEAWVFLTAEDIKSSKEAIRLEDRQLELALKSRENIPLVAIAKYPEPYAGLNPSVVVHVKSVGGLLGRSAVELLQSIVHSLEKAFSDFTIVEGVETTTIGGRRGAYMKATYTIADTSGKSYQTVSQVFLVPRGTVMFLISSSVPVGQESQLAKELEKTLASIRIER